MSWPQNTPPRQDDDAAAGIEISDAFERFTQRNDIFTRAFWDPKVKSKHTDKFFASYRMEAAPRRGDGFTQRDFALRNAAWLISRQRRDPRGISGGHRLRYPRGARPR